MHQLWQDLKIAVRMLAKRPGFAIVAILTLALGIGANTAIFSVVSAVLLKPLPYPDPDRIVMFMNISPQGSGAGGSATKFNAWRERTDTFQDITAYRVGGKVNLTGDSDPEQIPSGQVSANFFRLFGAPITQGRSFTAEEDGPNGGHVVLIGDGFWRRRFGGDPQILGKSIALDGDPYEVIGIVGPSFDRERFDPLPDVWLPFQLNPASIDLANYFLIAGRLKPGVTMADANVQMQLVTQEYRQKFPRDLDPKNHFGVKAISDVTIGDIRPSLRIFLAAVLVVLLISCANIANLLLVRATGRQREVAIRTALGSGRGRIVRQLLIESILLALAGGALGFFLGVIGIRALLAVSPGNIPRVGQDGTLVTADWRVVVFTIGVSVLTGFLFGLFPALQISRVNANTVLKEGGARSGSGLRHHRARSLLVVGELALAVILLIGSALLIRTFVALRNVNPGFESHNVLTMSMSLTGPRFEKTAGAAQLIRSGLERLRALPGVMAASATCCVPLEGGYGLPFIIVGRPLEGSSTGGAGWLTISSGYFETFRIPVKRGRAFTDADAAAAPAVAIINESMARKFWANGDPLNDRIVIGKGVGPEFENDPPRQIVGVVSDVRFSLDKDPAPVMYIPWAQTLDGVNALNVRLSELRWVARTEVEPHSLNSVIQRELREASGGLPVANIRTMDEIVVRSTARQHFNMLLMSVFAGSALLLAAIGIYGLMSYSVQQRTQEIGIRMALGAESHRVCSMVLFQGLRLALIGIAIGIVGAFGLARLIGSLLFGVKPWDVMVFVIVPIVLVTVALVSAWFPAIRASRVDLINALRYE